MGRLARAPVGLLSPSAPPAYAPLPRLPLLKRFSRSRFSRNVPSGMPPLSDAELSDLRCAVSVHGRDWCSVAATGVCGGRSADALRKAWDSYCRCGVVLAAGGGVQPVQQGVFPVSVHSVQPLPVDVYQRSARTVYSGRPWDYVVQLGGPRESPREPARLQRRWVHNWGLEYARGHGLLLCNLKRAAEKVRRYYEAVQPARWAGWSVGELVEQVSISLALRDELGLVLYPGQAGATITSECAGLNWIGGEAMGEGRFATAREVAAFMGISSRLGPYCVASRLYTNYQLCKLLAESVHSKVADFAATVVSHYLGHSVRTVGSMYSGAFDELGTGCQRMVAGLRRSFVSEIDPSKLRVLWESFGPDRCYGDVCEIDGCFPADILVASPPCLVFSKANRVSAPSDRLAEAASQVASIRRVISLLAPSAVILEQTEGLKTHCSEAYSLYEGLWGGFGYQVYHSTVDAHTTCGGSHHRSRLIWVAIRS